MFQKIKLIPEIANVSLAGFAPSEEGGVFWDNVSYNSGATEINFDVRFKPADTNYIHLYDIKLMAGTNIPYGDFANGFLINEKCAQVFGFKNPQEAIGKLVQSNVLSHDKIPIVGVFANFIQGSLHDEILPLAPI